MISGSPPTERNARTGLLTPPTRTFSALSKISLERRRSGFAWACVALIGAPFNGNSRFQPAGHVFGVVGQDNVGAGALNAGENFQDHALFINPAFLRSGFEHRVLAADVVRANRHVEAITHGPDDVEGMERVLDHHDFAAFFEIKGHFS